MSSNILIVEARFYAHISDMLLDGATSAIEKAGAHFERNVHQRRNVVKRHAHMLELHNGFRALRWHQGEDASGPLVKMRVRKNVSTKISTDAITTACVVALPLGDGVGAVERDQDARRADGAALRERAGHRGMAALRRRQ